jgi:hypothetical protein
MKAFFLSCTWAGCRLSKLLGTVADGVLSLFVLYDSFIKKYNAVEIAHNKAWKNIIFANVAQ